MVECPHCHKQFVSKKALARHFKEYGIKVSNAEHKTLKLYAKKFLKDLGFADSEIHEEYIVIIKGHTQNGEELGKSSQMLRVDVAGISANKRVAIECGTTPAHKIVWLKPFFDEVILLPHMKSFVSEEEKAILKMRRLRETLQRKEERYQARLKELNNREIIANKKVHSMNRDIILFLLGVGFLQESNFGWNMRQQIQKWRAEVEDEKQRLKPN